MATVPPSIIDNKWFSIVLSFIWGFGIAMLFRRVCKNDNCVVVKVSPMFNANRDLVYSKNKCYKLVKYKSKCVY